MLYIDGDEEEEELNFLVSLEGDGDGGIRLKVGDFYLGTVLQDEKGVYFELMPGFLVGEGYQVNKGYIKVTKIN